jgi:hypothetical protein
MRGLTRGQKVVLLIGVTLLGLAHASCARVQSHYVLPQLAVSDPSFLPTLEAYTSAALDGNTVDRLLNGDEIFPAALDAIRSARETITYEQYFYEEGAIGIEIAEALAERCRAGVRVHILLDGYGTLLIPAEYRDSMTRAGCEVSTFRPFGPLVLLTPLGFVEGLNNKIRVIQRRAYGLRTRSTCGSRSSPPCCRPSSVAEFDENDPHESPKTSFLMMPAAVSPPGFAWADRIQYTIGGLSSPPARLARRGPIGHSRLRLLQRAVRAPARRRGLPRAAVDRLGRGRGGAVHVWAPGLPARAAADAMGLRVLG